MTIYVGKATRNSACRYAKYQGLIGIPGEKPSARKLNH